MIWEKQGLVFCPDNNYEWMRSYASYPWAEHVKDDIYKIYFSCRNEFNRSHVGYVIIDLNQPSHILEISDKPVLSPGETGTFDDCGVSMSCILNHAEKKYLYYLGWNILVNVPWKNTIGLAVYNPSSETYERYSKAPVLGIHHVDPFTLTYPFVMWDEGIYKMWYGSSLFWGNKVEETNHVIKYATSTDGINWQRDNIICLTPEPDIEFALVKPFVTKENETYNMWFCFRQKSTYGIGYAASTDGISWKRNDALAGITVSSLGWDSEMVCYPYIFNHKGQTMMLYNGNGYGKTGFGLAILKQK